MTRLESLVESLRPLLQTTCSPIGALPFVVREYAASAERAQAESTVHELAATQRELCRLFNNLRAEVSALETASGNTQPAFYEGTRRCKGELPTACCICDITPGETDGIINT